MISLAEYDNLDYYEGNKVAKFIVWSYVYVFGVLSTGFLIWGLVDRSRKGQLIFGAIGLPIFLIILSIGPLSRWFEKVDANRGNYDDEEGCTTTNHTVNPNPVSNEIEKV